MEVLNLHPAHQGRCDHTGPWAQSPLPYTHTTAGMLSTQPLQLPSKGFILELALVGVLKEGST